MIPLGVLAQRRAAAPSGDPVTYQTFVGDEVDRSVYTFPAVPIGAAHANREVIVGIPYRQTAEQRPSSVTIGGEAATFDYYVAAINDNGYVMARAHVPTGSAADVVVTFPATAARCGLHVYTTGHRVSVVSSNGVSMGTSSLSTWSDSAVVTATDGFIVLGWYTTTTVTPTPSYTGVTGDHAGTLEAIATGSASGLTSAATTTISVDTGGAFIRQVACVAYEPA